MIPGRTFRIQIDGKIDAWQRAGYSGHHYTKKQTGNMEARINVAARMARVECLYGPVELLVYVFIEIPKSWPLKKKTAALFGDIRPTGKPDWDNYGKLTDALTLIAWKDDSQVVDGRVVKLYADIPGMDIKITELLPDAKPKDI